MQISLTSTQRVIAQTMLALFMLTPVMLWFLSQPVAVWTTSSGALRSIGHLCGIIGATLFSYNFILSARIGWIEEVLDGLPKVFSLHHLFGGLAFILLLVHPVFLGLQHVPYSISAAADFYLNTYQDFPKMLGSMALIVITVLLGITFFVRIAYHNWKATHQWLGLALVLASLHVYLIPGHLDSAPLLRGFMLTIMIAGLTAFAYRVLFGRWLVKRYSYTVDTVKVLQNIATEVRLIPASKPIRYQSGQFFFIRVHSNNGITRESHPFSFTSNPNQNYVSFTAKINGDYTAELPKLKNGTRVDLEGPYGRFLLGAGSKSQVWIAGGIGITPFLSRIREAKHTQQVQVHLYYVVKSDQQAIYAQELKATAQKSSWFTLTVWHSDTQGKFSANKIQNKLPQETEYYICGPRQMMYDLKLQLKTLRVPSQSIRLEEFKLY